MRHNFFTAGSKNQESTAKSGYMNDNSTRLSMNSPTAEKPLEVFISYSHKDEALKEELEVHLSTLKRQGKINPWQDRALEAGTEWDPQIKAALESAQIILLLITPRFMASDYINDVELARAMARHRAGTARVIPIILKPVDLAGTPIAQLQALPKDAKPVTRWEDQDEAFLNVVLGIRRVVDALNAQPATATAFPNLAAELPTPQSSPVTSSATAAVTSPQDEAQKRLALFQLLSALPGPTFDSIVYALNVPPPLMPPSMAPPGQRVAALLNWAQSPVGCGLDQLNAVVNSVVQTQ